MGRLNCCASVATRIVTKSPDSPPPSDSVLWDVSCVSPFPPPHPANTVTIAVTKATKIALFLFIRFPPFCMNISLCLCLNLILFSCLFTIKYLTHFCYFLLISEKYFSIFCYILTSFKFLDYYIYISCFYILI